MTSESAPSPHGGIWKWQLAHSGSGISGRASLRVSAGWWLWVKVNEHRETSLETTKSISLSINMTVNGNFLTAEKEVRKATEMSYSWVLRTCEQREEKIGNKWTSGNNSWNFLKAQWRNKVWGAETNIKGWYVTLTIPLWLARWMGG